MNHAHLFKAVIITFALLTATALYTLWQNSSLSTLRDEYTQTSIQTQQIALLKSRWSTMSSKAEFDYLKNHPNLIKQEKRGTNTYFEYDHLSMSEFNALTNSLFNSMLVIKKLTLRRDGTSSGVITVEIES